MSEKLGLNVSDSLTVTDSPNRIPPGILFEDHQREHMNQMDPQEKLWEEHKIKGTEKLFVDAQIKLKGGGHYKTAGNIEPLDLLLAGDMAWDKFLGDIIKYAFRSRRAEKRTPEGKKQDLEKIIHCAEILLSTIKR